MPTCILFVATGAWICGLFALCWYSYFQGKKCADQPSIRSIEKVRLFTPVVFLGMSYANVYDLAPLWSIFGAFAVVSDLLPSRFRKWGWNQRAVNPAE